MVEFGLEDGRDGRRAESGRVVPYVADVQPLVSVDLCVDSARRRDVDSPFRKDEADCSDLAS